jgi:hypothetical protein
MQFRSDKDTNMQQKALESLSSLSSIRISSVFRLRLFDAKEVGYLFDCRAFCAFGE